MSAMSSLIMVQVIDTQSLVRLGVGIDQADGLKLGQGNEGVVYYDWVETG